MRLIDADALKVNVARMSGNGDYVESVWWDIDHAPTADAQEGKRGKWINCVSSDHWKCSCCGIRASYWYNEENSSGWHKDMTEWLSDFCPNCGAKMNGKETEDG